MSGGSDSGVGSGSGSQSGDGEPENTAPIVLEPTERDVDVFQPWGAASPGGIFYDPDLEDFTVTITSQTESGVAYLTGWWDAEEEEWTSVSPESLRNWWFGYGGIPLHYIANPDAEDAQETITVEVKDSHEAIATYTVNVDLHAGLPTANDDSAEGYGGKPIYVNVIENDHDDDDEIWDPYYNNYFYWWNYGSSPRELQVLDYDAQIDEETEGVLELLDTGTFKFTPKKDFVGQISFTYTMTDGWWKKDAAVTIDVKETDVDYELDLQVLGPTIPESMEDGPDSRALLPVGATRSARVSLKAERQEEEGASVAITGDVELSASGPVRIWIPAWLKHGLEPGSVGGWALADGSFSIDELFAAQANGDRCQIASFDILIEGDANGDATVTATWTPEEILGQGEQDLEDSVTIQVGAMSASAPTEPIVINAGDVDHDGVVDMADGYDATGRPEDDQATGAFGQLQVTIPNGVNPQNAKITFFYTQDDPTAGSLDPLGKWRPLGTGLRLWRKDMSAPRTAADFVQAGVQYDLSSFATSGSGLTLYIEGTRLGDYQIGINISSYEEMQLAEDEGLQCECDDEQQQPGSQSGGGQGSGSGQGGGQQDPPEVSVQAAWYTATAHVRVVTPVSISATDAIAQERSDGVRDRATFTVHRGDVNIYGDVDVYYLLVYDSQRAIARDPRVDPANADFTVTGNGTLVLDPYTLVGRTTIRAGYTSADIELIPRDDLAVEWDEAVSIQLITYDHYRSLFDTYGLPTPGWGVPDPRSYYYIYGQSFAQAMILDDDGMETPQSRNRDLGGEGASVGDGQVAVDLQTGEVVLSLPINGPTYRTDANLRPLIEFYVRIPAGVSASSLSGMFSFAGIQGTETVIDGSLLDAYLDPNGFRELCLVFLAPDDLENYLPSGSYEYDLSLTFDGFSPFTRTIRGTTEIVNRIGAIYGQDEFGDDWTVESLDRLHFTDGFNHPTNAIGVTRTPVTRLGAGGAYVESGVTLARGDNSTAWFRATPKLAGGTYIHSVAAVYTDAFRWNASGSSVTTSDGLAEVENTAAYYFTGQTEGKLVQLFVNWDPAVDRATNASYAVFGARPAGGEGVRVYSIDQQMTPGEYFVNGRGFRSLGFFIVEDETVEIRLSTQSLYVPETGLFANGVVSAGDALLVNDWEFDTPAGSFAELILGTAAPVGYHAPPGFVPSPLGFALYDKWGTATSFSADGLETATVDRNGNRIEYLYEDQDGDGFEDELVKIKTQGGLEISFVYSGGRLHRVIDPVGVETTFTVSDGQVTSVENDEPGGSATKPSWSFEYDANGKIEQVTDARGAVTRIDWGTADRVESVESAGLSGDPTSKWHVTAQLVDGLGELRAPATGRIGEVEFEQSGGVREARARYVAPSQDAQTTVFDWIFQTDGFGYEIARALPQTTDDSSRPTYGTRRDRHGLAYRTLTVSLGG